MNVSSGCWYLFVFVKKLDQELLHVNLNMINKSIYVFKYFDLPIGSELPMSVDISESYVVAFLLRAHVLALADPHGNSLR